MNITEPFRCVLGIEMKEGKQNLFVLKVGAGMDLGDGAILLENFVDKSIQKKLLVVDIRPPAAAHLALEQLFTFTQLEVLTIRDDIPSFFAEAKPITLIGIRELINDLSICHNGKTFTERDFNNAVFLQASTARDDNRNQDECFNDASILILYLFLYGFLEDILTKNSNLCYNMTIEEEAA